MFCSLSELAAGLMEEEGPGPPGSLSAVIMWEQYVTKYIVGTLPGAHKLLSFFM